MKESPAKESSAKAKKSKGGRERSTSMEEVDSGKKKGKGKKGSSFDSSDRDPEVSEWCRAYTRSIHIVYT